MAEAALSEGMPAAIERFHASEPGSRARERNERRAAARAAEPGDEAGEAPAAPEDAG